jgi:hypothetical protein
MAHPHRRRPSDRSRSRPLTIRPPNLSVRDSVLLECGVVVEAERVLHVALAGEADAASYEVHWLMERRKATQRSEDDE